jgi:hypothetical protein
MKYERRQCMSGPTCTSDAQWAVCDPEKEDWHPGIEVCSRHMSMIVRGMLEGGYPAVLVKPISAPR